MKRLRNYSVRGKIILSAILCIVLSVLIFFGLTYPDVQKDVHSALETNYQLTLNTIGSRLEQAFYEMHLMGAKLSHIGGLSDQVKEYMLSKDLMQKLELETQIRSQLIVEDSFSTMIGTLAYYYPDEDADISLIANHRVPSFIARSRTEFFRQDPMSSYNLPRQSIRSEETVLSLSRYVGDAGPHTEGEFYIYVETDPDFLAELFRELKNPDGTQMPVYLLDAQNRAVYQQGTGPVQEGEVFPEEGLKDYIPYSFESKNWSLRLCVPKVDHQQIQFSVFGDFAVMLLIFLILYGLMAAFIFRSVYRPLDAFVKELSENNLAGLMRGAARYREFDEFSHKIDQMRSQISQLIAQVELQSKQNAYLENQFLRSKISPHFLHNTLNSISIQASGEGQEELAQTIQALNHLMYHNLGKNKITTLHDELRAAEDYILLQHRIQKFEYYQDVELSEELRRIHMPAFVLQPLLENCFKHGGTADLMIRLRVRQEGSDLLMTLEDNGQGIPEETREKLNRQLSGEAPQELGIGLAYVASALRMYYADQASMHVGETTGGHGTGVTILIKNPDRWTV